jgi:DNA-binding protein H-NS
MADTLLPLTTQQLEAMARTDALLPLTGAQLEALRVIAIHRNNPEPTMTRPTYKELLAESEKLLAQAMDAKKIESRAAVETCKALITEFDLTPFDLGFVKTQVVAPVKVKKGDATFAVKKPKMTHPPKYVDPASGKTWSGRGHQPAWIVGNRDDYLIKTGHGKRTTQNNKGHA